MAATALAWYWLEVDCRQYVRQCVLDLQNQKTIQNTWLSDLVNKVYTAMNAPNSRSKRSMARQFSAACLPTLDDPARIDHVINVPTARPPRAQIPDKIVKLILSALRQWLGYPFPSNISMVSGFFVWHIVHVVRNDDILLFPEVWKAFQQVRCHALPPSVNQLNGRNIQLHHLEPFRKALASSPIADPTSLETSLLADFSSRLAAAACTTTSFAGILAQAMQSPPISPPLPLLSPQARADGRSQLVRFLRDLLPLLQHPLPTRLTRIQLLVNSHKDFFGPWREKCPSRIRLTQPDGPFANLDQPGGFASAAMSRALFFGTPWLHEQTSGFFPSVTHWNQALSAAGFDPAAPYKDHKHFYNIHCYGTAQGGRRDAFLNKVPFYYQQEPEWRKLVDLHAPHLIPFRDFLRWTQRTRPIPVPGKDKPGRESLLPEVGKLTGYLLAVDLVYAKRVLPPTPEELGGIIADMNLGSRCGLRVTHQIRQKADKSEVAQAFAALHSYLLAQFSPAEQALMGLDIFMVEHLLCKFQRVDRYLSRLGG